jgi:hypothetical protein
MQALDGFSTALEALTAGPPVRPATLDSVPKEQGIYALWCVGPPERCLKVGIAGPRGGSGMRNRLAFHYSSNPSSSVLAQHLAADTSSAWVAGRDFTDRVVRQGFLAKECYFRVVAVPGFRRAELLLLERRLVGALQPVYAGRIRPTRPDLQRLG